MSVTVFGIAWVTIAFFAMIANRINAMVVFTMASMVLQCDIVLYLGGVGIGPQILASILFIVKSFAYASAKSRMSVDSRYISALALALAIAVGAGLNGVLSSVAINVTQLSIYILCFIRFFAVGRMVGRNDMLRYFRWLVVFVSAIGVIQYFIVLGVVPRLGILSTLIYNDPNPSIYYNLSRSPRLYSTFMEPSYCAPFLVGAFYFIMISVKEKSKADHALLVLLLVEIVATQSTTGYVAFIAMGAIHLIVFRDRATARYLIPEMVVLLVALLMMPDLLNDVIFLKAETGSASTRGTWNDRALANFAAHPVIGIGYKQSRASSLLFSLMAETGIIGLASYLALIVLCVAPRNIDNSERTRCGKTLVLAVVACQFIAIPDVDFCVFWLCMYVYAGIVGASRVEKAQPVESSSFAQVMPALLEEDTLRNE